MTRLLPLLVAALAFGCGCQSKRSEPSAEGSRVVTLAPSLAEISAEILGEQRLDRIVGVSDYTDYPNSLKSKPSVGSFAQFNVEKVVSLKPTLVLATTDGNSKEQVQRLIDLGLTVVVVQTSSLQEIEQSFRKVGKALGEESQGNRIADHFSKKVEEFRVRGSSRSRNPSVLVQLGSDPLVVVGGKGFLSQAIQLVGARNVYGDSTSGYPQPSLEDALARNPDHILVLTMGTDRSLFEKMVQDWNRFPSIPAVAHKRVTILNGDDLARPSSRLLKGLASLEELLFP
jgi:ABC-type Fe3+-hydroxamate transport system substrate-binding protein